MYFRYLKKLYEKSSAAWRREMRKNSRPCEICGDENSEIMAEGNWLCREHKALWKLMLPYKSHAQRLIEMGIPFLTEEEHKAGVVAPKKKRKSTAKLEVKAWDYSAGRAAPAKKTTTRKKK
jgi:hypothetical protein